MKNVIGIGNWLLFHRMKQTQLVNHIAFLRLCKQNGFIPNGLRCRDISASTIGCAASTKLAEKYSF